MTATTHRPLEHFPASLEATPWTLEGQSKGNLAGLDLSALGAVETDPVLASVNHEAAPVAPLSMAALAESVHPESMDGRARIEKSAADAILAAAADNPTALAAIIANPAEVAPQLAENPALLAWMRTQAEQRHTAAKGIGGQVLEFVLRPYGHRAGYRKSFFEERGIRGRGSGYVPQRYAE
jgi:hypothetical protein